MFREHTATLTRRERRTQRPILIGGPIEIRRHAEAVTRDVGLTARSQVSQA